MAGRAWCDRRGGVDRDGICYSGAPGVVLFLLELHRATGEARYLDEARAGADALMARVPTIAEPGLYTGLAGVGFTLAEVARVTGEAKYREGARAVVAVLARRAKPVGDGVEWNDVTDIIAGSAGTGLFLLHAAKALDLPEARVLAAKAGRRLLALGRREAGGLKWAMSPEFPRLMPNFSHGTAGIATSSPPSIATRKTGRFSTVRWLARSTCRPRRRPRATSA